MKLLQPFEWSSLNRDFDRPLGSGIGGDVHFDLDENWVEEQAQDDEANGRQGNALGETWVSHLSDRIQKL